MDCFSFYLAFHNPAVHRLSHRWPGLCVTRDTQSHMPTAYPALPEAPGLPCHCDSVWALHAVRCGERCLPTWWWASYRGSCCLLWINYQDVITFPWGDLRYVLVLPDLVGGMGFSEGFWCGWEGRTFRNVCFLSSDGEQERIWDKGADDNQMHIFLSSASPTCWSISCCLF